MNASLVQCVDVARTYGAGPTAVVAVHGASCEIPQRARIALTGPSGSGKSTLLHLMAGLEKPTYGSVKWPAFDGDPHGRPGLVGVVFQGPSLLPPLDVLENVTLPLILAGVSASEARDRSLDALARLQLEDLQAKLPEELSGGQSQRVAVARVLAGQPRLVLADEPTGQLDRDAAKHVVDVLLTAVDELGAALVVSTHDSAVADRLRTIWRVHDGRLMRPADGDAAPNDEQAVRT